MIKKWLNIVLCIWLINSVTYFHPNNPFADCEESGCFAQACSKINTWVDNLVHVVADDDKDTPAHQHHQVGFQRRYVHSGTNVSNSFLPQLHFTFSFSVPAKQLFNSFKYAVTAAKLPLYYNFLFRLSPF